jgi:hypothetical protein
MVGGLKNDATLVGNPVRARAADKWKIDAVTERPHYTVVYLANPLIGRPPRKQPNGSTPAMRYSTVKRAFMGSTAIPRTLGCLTAAIRSRDPF